jgi:hypothetical protein
MKKVRYVGDKDAEEVELGDMVHVVRKGTTLDVPNEKAEELLKSENWQDARGSKSKEGES